MVWSAKVSNVRYDNGVLTVEVIYSDGNITVDDKFFNVKSNEDLRLAVIKKINDIENRHSLSKNIVVGEIDLTPPVSPQIPPEEVERQLYFELLRKWNNIKEDIQNNLIQQDDPLVTKLLNDLRTAYKPKYSGL